MAYDGAYGTYDCPGLFRIKTKSGYMEVLGIEFRMNDRQVEYPKNLKSLILNQGLIRSDTFIKMDAVSKDDIWRQIKKTIETNVPLKTASYQHLISTEGEPDLIQIFTLNNRKKYLISAKKVDFTPKYISLGGGTHKEKELYDLANRDKIIGCHNWNYMWENIAYLGFTGIRDFTFVYFDIKDFKALNVVYVHVTANEVLRRIANKMENTEWIYHVARSDNDNFAMMIRTMPNDETLDKLKKLFSELEAMPEIPNYSIFYRVGVVPMKTSLLLGPTVADAGKQVQRMGCKNYMTEINFYTESMYDQLNWSEQIKAYVDIAIKKDEFAVYLQPKYDIRTEKIHGAEALIRWNLHGKELLAPYKFIPIFEQDGLITKIDVIVLHKVCQYFKSWKARGIALHPISVNLSRKSLGMPDLVEHLTAIVDEYDVSHELIDFELTESSAHDDQSYMIHIIQMLKNKGFKISLDDFGTGYSSLSLLTVLPMDTIKIDKSFVDGICGENSSKECSVLRHIISMAKDLNLTCLAEGAETGQQFELLRSFVCEIVQGYYYSKPLPVEEYEKKLV
ncbi:MAG: GGDEF domain-containing phosphodiesterase [Treponema sp.]|nr:GGDEF domain-containing phosphodiesterase [Treponema sp.]